MLDSTPASQAAENTGEGGIYVNTQVGLQGRPMCGPAALPPRRLALCGQLLRSCAIAHAARRGVSPEHPWLSLNAPELN